jgi:hypothetical protein
MTDPTPHGCTIDGQPAMPILISEYNQLTADLAALRAVARGYCPACGRGDAAPTVADWEQQKQRADQAEAAIARVRRVAALIRAGAPWTANHRDTADQIETALTGDGDQEQPAS